MLSREQLMERAWREEVARGEEHRVYITVLERALEIRAAELGLPMAPAGGSAAAAAPPHTSLLTRQGSVPDLAKSKSSAALTGVADPKSLLLRHAQVMQVRGHLGDGREGEGSP